MKETNIHVRPERVMLAWQVARFSDSFFSRCRDDSCQRVTSGFFEFCGSEIKRGIAESDACRHSSMQRVNFQGFKECKTEVRHLIAMRMKYVPLSVLLSNDKKNLESVAEKGWYLCH
ncbi:hypothetical protein MCEMSHM24_01734 [Comamonadaceae bacterium]